VLIVREVELDDSNLVIDNSHWTMKEKTKFCMKYFLNGNFSDACREFGVSRDTANGWKKQTWFTEMMSRLRTEADAATDRKLTNIIERGFAEIEDRLVNGEERTLKDGSVIKIKANLTSLTIATGTMFDKRQLLRKTPIEDSSADDILVRLAEKLRDFAKPKDIIEAEDVEYRDET